MMKRLLHNPLTLAFHIALTLMLIGAIITHYDGESAMLLLRVGENSNMAVREDGRVMDLPFSVRLNKFSVETYEDGKAHKNYISHITVSFFENSGKKTTHEVKVAMNNPYHISSVKGLGCIGAEYSLLQMSYDTDLKGTTLLVQHDPWGIGITFVGYYILLVACLLMFIRHCCKHRREKTYWRCLGVAFIGASVYVVGKLFSSSASLMPVLRSPYLVVHVSVIIMAYILMLCMMIKSLKVLFSKSPTIGWNGTNLLLPAVILLTAGIFIGAIWANESWGRYWGWDPKETWALITLIVYSLPLHRHSLRLFLQPRFYHLYIILAFLSVIITYFGVNYLIGGLHSYA